MTDWSIPQQAKLKYTQLFNLHDRSRSGFLSGLQCRDILMQSGLPRNTLAEIWNLSDIDADGQLTREEFILAMHLTNQVRTGQTLPAELPSDLVPPSYRRLRSTSSTSIHSNTSSISTTSGAPGCVINDDQASHKSNDTIAATPSATSTLNSNSFEDKRRENFEKGRAELERRRLNIIEQQTSILGEQLVKCKKQVAEAKSKIDAMRSERDTKAGLITALEAQLATVRDRKAFLQHEELQIIAIAKDLNLVNSTHSTDFDQQATIAKQESINQMKEKLAEMQHEKETTLKQVDDAQMQLDKAKQELQSILEQVTKSYERYEEKIAEAKILREKFIEENKAKTIDLDSVWDTAPSLSNLSISNKQSVESTNSGSAITVLEGGSVFAQQHSPQSLDSNGNAAKANINQNLDLFQDHTSITSNSKMSDSQAGKSLGNNLSESSVNKSTAVKKVYKALYAFEARNPDELTINPGDMIIGSEEVCEPGWLSGSSNGRSGLFPEAYVEPVTENLSEIHTTPASIGASSITAASSADRDPYQAPQRGSQSSLTNENASSNPQVVVKYKVIYAFSARHPDELTINPGDIITGAEGPHEPGWLVGELNGQKGLFPEAYVEKMAEAVLEQTGHTLRRGSSSGSLRSKKSRSKKAEVATVIANYRALGQEQLNLEKGQLVLIRRKMESGWWEGELQIKEKAHIECASGQYRKQKPSELDCLIRELVDSEWDYVNDLRLCQSAYIFPLSSSFNVSAIFTNWNQLIQSHECALSKLAPNQLNDYNLVLETFSNLLQSIVELYVDFCSKQIESSRQLESKIASDIRFRQLISESQRKLRKLIEQQVVVDNSNEQDERAVAQRNRALRNSNLPLTSFLLKPMQRITKYGLLFERMLKVACETESLGGLHHHLERLKTFAQELCQQVNEACRMKEDDEDNQRKLRWCRNHIKQQFVNIDSNNSFQTTHKSSTSTNNINSHLSSNSIATSTSPNSSFRSTSSTSTSTPIELIQFACSTKYLGPRKFVKAASLFKFRSGRELICFLFNDFLLLTHTKGGGGMLKVDDVFKSERAQQLYYKFYKSPIMLEDIQLDNFDNDLYQQQTQQSLMCPSLNSSSSTSLSHDDLLVSFLDCNTCTVYNLLASSTTEKIDWMKKLSDYIRLAREAKQLDSSQNLLKASRRLSINDSFGRLFVTVLELFRTVDRHRYASVRSVGDFIQNLRIRIQMRLYTRSQMSNVEVIALSDEYKTSSIIISNLSEFKRQPVMVEMDECLSLPNRDTYQFENESTQFLIPKEGSKVKTGVEYLDIELLDDSRFKETQVVGRKRISIDHLLGRSTKYMALTDNKNSLHRTASNQSSNNIQVLHSNRPVDMIFKLRPPQDNNSNDQTKYSVKIRLHLQTFCDIDSLI